ncbi:hypothetical protein HBIMPC_12970 [Chitinophaga sp. 212800010-3]|nr:hypothetical protein [Chitinophaga sp. 212800010-3]
MLNKNMISEIRVKNGLKNAFSIQKSIKFH